jgi:Fe-S cluster assembly protein SufD
MTATAFALSLQDILSNLLQEQSKAVLHTLKSAALKKFEELGLPNKSDEAFQYFPLHSFYEANLQPPQESSIVDQDFVEKHLIPECRNACLVFVDGQFRPELCVTDALDSKIAVLTLEEAMKTYSHFLQGRILKQIKEEIDPFALLNLSLHRQGGLLYIPPKLILESPIQVLQVITQESTLTAPRLHIFVGAQAEAKIHMTCACLQKKGLTLGMTDIAIEEGATLQMGASACGCFGGWQMEYVRVGVKRDGRYQAVQIAKGCSGFRKEIKVDLIGENASAEISALALLQNQDLSHLRVLVNHEAPNTTSQQHFKGVLKGKSRSNFEGKILVQKLAQQTQAYQLCNHLILDEQSLANVKPNLEIFADDVKASHGATISQVKEDELFYLLTRGIDPKLAKNLLVEGFCEEIRGKAFLESVQDEIKTWIGTHSV